MDLQEVGGGCEDWMELTQDRDRWRALSRQLAHEGGKVVSPTHRPLYSAGNTSDTHFCRRLSRPQGHSASGRIMSIKNLNDIIESQTHDLPVCSEVPQPTALPCTLIRIVHTCIYQDP